MTRSRLNGSPRRNLFTFLKEEAESVRGGRYAVKRGAVNWVRWDFKASPYGIAICHDQGFLFGGTGKAGARRGTVTLEMAAKMRRYPGDQADGFDEELVDELLDDAASIVDAAARAQNAMKQPLLIGFMRGNVTFVEFHDAQLGVQGVVVEFEVDY